MYGRLLGPDAALLKARVAAMARAVCDDDPRTLAQRRADAAGALAAGSTVLSCACDNPDCPAAVDDGRATSVVVHVIAEQASTDATPDPQLHGEGLVAEDAPPPTPASRRCGGRPPSSWAAGSCPAPLLAELLAHGATVKVVGNPGQDPEPHYRPSTALDEFVRLRDLTCRFPGCDRPATVADIDHTVPYPAGPTHAGALKCYCRKHPGINRFRPQP